MVAPSLSCLIFIFVEFNYPRLCIKIGPTIKLRVAVSAKPRQISQARVLRDALTDLFVGPELVDEDFLIFLSRAVVRNNSKYLR